MDSNPTVALIVPFAGNDPHRNRAWEWIRARYHSDHPEWEIVTGACEGEWVKAHAVTDALTQTAADLLVIADADVWCDQLPEFVTKVSEGVWEWASPHRRIVRLNQATTEHVYREGFPESIPHARLLTEQPYDGMVGGGIVILPRTLYEQCPLDPRFVGWGGEDEAWGRALLTLTKKRNQGRNILWHLYHQPQARVNRKIGNPANDLLKERYRLAAGDPAATLALIEEGRHATRHLPRPRHHDPHRDHRDGPIQQHDPRLVIAD